MHSYNPSHSLSYNVMKLGIVSMSLMLGNWLSTSKTCSPTCSPVCGCSNCQCNVAQIFNVMLQTEGWVIQRSLGWPTSCVESLGRMIVTAGWQPWDNWRNSSATVRVKWLVWLHYFLFYINSILRFSFSLLHNATDLKSD